MTPAGLGVVLPARYRMTRSADFGATVSSGRRAAQPDLVVHALHVGEIAVEGPKIGLVVAKSVGGAVVRHRVARKLRHVVYAMVGEFGAGDRVVIRALPGSRHTPSAHLERQLRAALRRTEVVR